MRRSMVSFAFAAAILTSTLLFVPTSLAASTSAAPIASQPLARALEAVHRLTGLQIMYVTELTEGLTSRAAPAGLSAEKTLQRVLEGTGLTYQWLDSDAVQVTRQEPDIAANPQQFAPSAAGPQMAEAGGRGERAGASELNTSGRATDSSADPVEEIVVTAEKRAESIQTLPIAISAYSGELLEERGIVDISQLSQLSPSVRVPLVENKDLRVLIRGIGSFGGREPSVAMVQDGVAYSSVRMGSSFSFFDVERIEVLRGPQGTIGGRNATAGGVYITSRSPSDEVEGFIRGTVGNYGRLGVEGAIGGPIIEDKLLARLAMGIDRADGWITNSLTAQDFNDIDNKQARLSLQARFNDDFRALLVLQTIRDRSQPALVAWDRSRPDRPLVPPHGCAACQFNPDNDSFSAPRAGTQSQKADQASLRLEYDIGGNAQLTAITGYIDTDVQIYAPGSGPFETGIPGFVNPTVEQLSQEITLTGDFGERLDFIVGGLYQRHDFLETFNLAAGVFVGGDVNTLSSWAGYGQLRYRLTDSIRLTAGARYTHDRKTAHSIVTNPIAGTGTDTRGEGKWGSWTPRFSLDWQPNDSVMAYATAARGFKSGGFVLLTTPVPPFDPEYVWNYEAGVKLQGWDRRVQADFTAFTMNYSNLQQRLISFNAQTGRIDVGIVNASKARIRGAELNLQARPVPALELSAAGTYLHGRYQALRSRDPLYPELGELQADGVTRIRDLSGNRLAGMPDWQFNLGANYTARITDRYEAVIAASYSWNGTAYMDFYNNPGIVSEENGLTDLSLTLQSTDERWRLRAFVQNLTDELYVSQSLTSAADNRRLVYFGQPRRYGVALEHRF